MALCRYRMNKDRLIPCQQPRQYGRSGRYPDLLGLKGAQAERQVSRQMARLNRVLRLKLAPLGAQEAGGTRGVAVKCIDITKNPDCEGSLLGCYRRSCSKVRVSNRIRYPGSPHSKRWMPAIRPMRLSGQAKALSIPPGEYAGNGETQRN